MGVPGWLRRAAGFPAKVWSRTTTQVTARRATGVAVVVLLVGGALLWATGTNETKQADLGSAILGGLIVGLAVILAERHYSQTVGLKLEDVSSLTPTAPAEPTRDDPTRPSGEGQPGRRRPLPGRYTVRFDTRERVRNRADAFQARLRVFRDGDYFQFVTALAPGRVEELTDIQANEFWWSFCRLAGQLAERALREGLIPLDDPTMAYQVHPDVEAAVRLAARERTPVTEDAVVWQFDVGQPFADDLRRAKAEGVSVRIGLKNGETSGLWGVRRVEEELGLVTFEVPVTGGVTNLRAVTLDQIAWVEVTDIAF